MARFHRFGMVGTVVALFALAVTLTFSALFSTTRAYAEGPPEGPHQVAQASTDTAQTPTPPPPSSDDDEATGASPAQTLEEMRVYLPLIRRASSMTSVSGNPDPIVVQQSPARGEEFAPDGAVTLTFDRAMDQSSVEAAFQLVPVSSPADSSDVGATAPTTPTTTPLPDTPDTPDTGDTAPAQTGAGTTPVAGSFAWNDERTLVFHPDQPLQRSARYRVQLAPGAQAADGSLINEAYQYRFATAGYLEVGQVIPAEDTPDVAPESAITVLFNRPVVPLRMVEDRGTLPHPLTFQPDIPGSGEWLNTSVYVFHPDEPLTYDTTYTAMVDGSLTDVTDNPLREPFSWQFTVAPPPQVQVVAIAPWDGSDLVPIETVIQVEFDQPVDPASARQSFSLSGANNTAVAGDMLVMGDTLVFTPAQRLGFDQTYTIAVENGLASASGGRPLPNRHTSTFSTVPLPRITSTDPADGDTDVQPYSQVKISFNTPIDPDTVMPEISVTPPMSPTQVYTYFSPYDNAFHLGYDMLPTTTYEIMIGPGIADPYGNTIGVSRTLRFTTGQMPPYINLATPGYISTYSAYNPTRVLVRSVNVSQAHLQLYRLKEQDLFEGYSYYNEPPEGATLVRDWQAPISSPPDAITTSRIPLDENGGTLEPGIYMLLLDTLEYPDQPHILVVSPLNLTLKAGERDALVWANDLQSGRPVPNLTLDFYDQRGNLLGNATTDSQGVARLDIDRTENNGVIAIARQTFAAVTSEWYDGVSSWDFGLPGIYNLPELTAHIYTDRPIYRPDQSVSFKGVLRTEDDVTFDLPNSIGSVNVVIYDPVGEEVYNETLQLSANATFHGEVQLPASAPTGNYTINVQTDTQSFSSGFQVASYRPPEFEVGVSTPSDEVVLGSPFQATVHVDYLFGAPVQDAPVNWTVSAKTYIFSPDWAARYRFTDSDDPWFCWDCWWMPGVSPEPILSGSGTTSNDGTLVIDLPATLTDSDGEPLDDSTRLTIEATATGKDNQVVSNRSEVVVHRSEVYVGLANRGPLARAGDEQQIDILTVNTQAQPHPQQTVELEAFRYTWDNIYLEDEMRWEWKEQRTLVFTDTVTTDGQGQATTTFTPPEGGSYRVVATTRDADGRESRASVFLWVAGDTFVPWRRDNNDRITLIADKTTYTPGETAEILVPSPFQGPHWALFTVERGGVLSHEVREMTGNSTIYRLDLTDTHVPNVYVSVVLFSPPTTDTNNIALPPDYKVGILPLEVKPEPQTLRVTLTPDKEEAEPGDTVRYDIQVTDLLSQPVAAELSLDLVDKAVLTLKPRVPNAIVAAFYDRRGLGIVTASGMALLADRLQPPEQSAEDIVEEEEVFDEIDQGLMIPSPSPTLSPDFAAEEPPGDKRGGGANAPEQTIREEFADTAYWNAMVETDASGRATVDVTLPDNLTTWIMRGVGLNDATQVGEGTVAIVATKPVLIRPVVPRFFVVGDRVQLAANVSNRTDEPLEAQVSLTATGLTATTPLSQTILVPASGEAQATWDVVIGDVTATDLVFRVAAGNHQDASKPRLATGPDGTIPVYRYSAPETVGTGGQLVAGGARTDVIMLPPRFDDRNGQLTVRLDPSLAASMPDSLTYLEHFEYECTEQTVSRFLPNIVTVQALQRLGISNPDLEDRLPDLVNEGVNRLTARQHSDGGWGWWIDDESKPALSAYVVFGLVKAKEAGYTVPEDVLARGINYLTSVASSAPELTTTRLTNQQAWLLYVLSVAGESNEQLVDDVYKNRDNLSHYASAYLALTIHQANPDDPRINALLSDLNNAAILSATGAHWEEAVYDYWHMNTDTRTTAIALSALATLDPDNQLAPNVVRWLMVAREGSAWETTQETAWAIMALTDWMAATGELHPDYDYGVWLNPPGEHNAPAMREGHFGEGDVNQPQVLQVAVADLLRDTGNWLTIGRGDGSGRLYYTAHLQTYLPVEDIEPLNRGIIVQRRYTLARCDDGPDCPEVNQVAVGETIRVEVSVIAPNDLHYLVVTDPLPAGTEVVDTSLATTSQDTPEPGVTRTSPREDWYWWWWWRWYTRSEFRDEKVVLFADSLSSGTYLYTYTIRATQPGDYHVIPTTAQEFYFPEVYGRGAGQMFQVTTP